MRSFVTNQPVLAGAASGLAIMAALSSPVLGHLALSWTGIALAFGAAGTTGALLGGVVSLSRANHMLSMTVGHMSGELMQLRATFEEQNQRLVDVERKAAESPALVWRAAAADIEALGNIVSSLAGTVNDHENRLIERLTPPPAMNDSAPLNAEHPFMPVAANGLRPALLLDVPAPLVVEPVATPLTEFRTTLATALLSDKMELHLQPIVTLPQRQIVGYEASLCLAGQDGQSRSADDLRRIATATNMTLDLDGIVLERAMQVLRVLRARGREVMLICHICAQSLADKRIVEQLVSLLRGDDSLGRSLVLAVDVADILDVAERDKTAADTLSLIRQLGPTLSGIVPFGETADMRPLAKLGLSHIRIDAATFLTAIETGQPFGDIHGADIGALLKRSGIDLSITGVSDEAMVRDLLDQDAVLAQGELFGVARPVRPEVLEPREVTGEITGKMVSEALPPIDTQKQAQEPAPVVRQSFRSLLRRA